MTKSVQGIVDTTDAVSSFVSSLQKRVDEIMFVFNEKNQ